MKNKISFEKPFRIGIKQRRTILDAKGREVVIFPKGFEGMAKEYCVFLNNKE